MSKKMMLASLIAAIGYSVISTILYQANLIDAYKEQNRLLKELNIKNMEWCEGVQRVNNVCSNSLIDIMERLGLDKSAYPLVTTVMWRRAMSDYPIDEARARLGAPPQAEGENLSDVSIGGIGGVDEESEDEKIEP